ncbi:hypothetical protein [Microbacterium sp. GCS4]|uniref:hypothetical protein n=1 Tax=Microbacterium sp. GCS4 TaxID=1692239 RepID=UPI000680E245|nr:hypothetical protein [Microbacterium sp. GCS4]KNY05729.1 hypothetical protein AKH00_07505 [Microbacterium sp. GCS4]
MSDVRLVDLMYRGEFDEAIEVARPFTPDEIYNQILRDDDRHLITAGPCDEFIRRWYETIDSPYLRAEAADCFVSAFTTQLAPVPNGEYIGAYLRTASLRDLIQKVSSALLGIEIRDLEETPEHPLDPDSARRWRKAGRILAALDLPEPVSPIAPPDDEWIDWSEVSRPT